MGKLKARVKRLEGLVQNQGMRIMELQERKLGMAAPADPAPLTAEDAQWCRRGDLLGTFGFDEQSIIFGCMEDWKPGNSGVRSQDDNRWVCIEDCTLPAATAAAIAKRKAQASLGAETVAAIDRGTALARERKVEADSRRYVNSIADYCASKLPPEQIAAEAAGQRRVEAEIAARKAEQLAVGDEVESQCGCRGTVQKVDKYKCNWLITHPCNNPFCGSKAGNIGYYWSDHLRRIAPASDTPPADAPQSYVAGQAVEFIYDGEGQGDACPSLQYKGKWIRGRVIRTCDSGKCWWVTAEPSDTMRDESPQLVGGRDYADIRPCAAVPGAVVLDRQSGRLGLHYRGALTGTPRVIYDDLESECYDPARHIVMLLRRQPEAPAEQPAQSIAQQILAKLDGPERDWPTHLQCRTALRAAVAHPDDPFAAILHALEGGKS